MGCCRRQHEELRCHQVSGSVSLEVESSELTLTALYLADSKAILSRKAYPLAPDENMPENGERYEQRRGRVYYGKDLELSR
jgi:hypothetical protein